MRRPFDLRRRIVARDRLRTAGQWATIVALAGAIYLAVLGKWAAALVAAAVCAALGWLSGSWLAPWGSERYLNRVAGAVEQWVERTCSADASLARQRAALVRSASGVDFSGRSGRQHRRLVALLEEFARTAHDVEALPEVGLRKSSEQWSEIRAARDQLLERAATGDAASSAAMRKAFAQYAAEREACRLAAISATDDAIRRLEELRAPQTVTADHDDLVLTLTQYRERLDIVLRNLDSPESVGPLARDLLDSHDRMWQAAEAVNRRVGAHIGWDMPDEGGG